jgi:hypothetical protein
MDETVKKILDDHEKRIAELEAVFRTSTEPVQKRLSPKEFLISKKPKDDIQKTLLLGYYLERHRSLLAFNAKDLENVFREAKEAPPDNINDKVNKNVQKGHIMDAGEKKDKMKAWNLTASGERFVEDGLLVLRD